MAADAPARPLVSVVVPSYNGRDFLVPAMRSVLDQSLKDLELVLVDDGSTDGSLELAEAEARRDPRVRVVRSGGGGLAGAPNLGLARSRGRFIALMDHDDLSRPQRLRRQADYLLAHPDVGVLAGQSRCFGSTRWHKNQLHFPTEHAGLQARALFECPVAKPTVMLRPEILPADRALFDRDDIWFEDYGAWTRLLFAGVRFAALPEVVLDYRVHPGQVSADKAGQQESGADRVRLRWLSRLLGPVGPPREALHLGVCRFRWGRGLGYLRTLEDWLLTLRAAAAASDFLDPKAFDRVLAHRWASALWANRGLGRPLFSLAQASPLRRLPHPKPWKAWAARWGGLLPRPGRRTTGGMPM